ncbi:hypothetical protein LAZ67_5000482 [Cordylochernes scorpioides]|uniref:Uncharacterized protein n=1 Tax=Cordylochernes scorpioides TaxID=51811 RepID=A0ABY6KI26_9ARAC|nr:hypothetical protein LAZ67_5000482 [Cordylochernes scorpioides]
MAENIRIPEFNGENFHSWKFRIEAFLEGKGLKRYLYEDPPQLEDKTDWSIKDAQAKGIMTSAMNDSQVSLILNCKTTKDIWNSIHRRYEGDIKKQKIEAKNNLFRMQMKKDENLNQFLLRSEKLLETARILGNSIEEEEFVDAFIKALPTKYNIIVMQLSSISDPGILDIRRIVQLYLERYKFQEKEENPNAYKMFTKENVHFNRNTTFENTRPKRKIQCFICSKYGHKANDCWYNPKNKGENSTRKNNGPQSNTHSWKTRQNVPRATAAKVKEEQTFTTISKEEEIKEDKYQGWILDSGATCHMTSSLEQMKDIQPDERKIVLADGSYTKSNYIGNVKLNGVNHFLILNNVLHVPSLTDNLISVNKLVQENNKVIFDQKGGHIIDQAGYTIITANKVGDLYFIKGNNNKIDITFKVTNIPWEVWHKRLGHINDQYMEIMKKNQLVYKFDYNEQKSMENCISCIKGKYSRKPFKTVTENQSNQPLELLHLDLIGPIKQLSIGSAKYVLTIVDDFSRKIFVKFLHSKSDTLEIFKEFLESTENLLNKRAKCIRSDNGLEFVNQEFENYLKNKGIIHQKTTIYTPPQNGIAERANRSIINGTRTLLVESELPTKFWAEAMHNFVYTKNRTPNKHNLKITPEELFTGKKPTVAHLRTFGCIAEFWIPKEKRAKFDMITHSGIFMGYSSNRKAYRIFNPNTYSIVESRDVKFIENKKGVSLLKSDQNEVQDYCIFKFPEENFDYDSENKPSEESNIQELEEATQQQQNNVVPYLRPSARNKYYCELSSDEEELSDDSRLDPTFDPTEHNLFALDEIPIPNSYEEAINSKNPEYWIEAMQREMNSLQEHQVWDHVYLPKGVKPIKSKWVYSSKVDPSTGQTIFKARLVALGCCQKDGTYFQNICSPVMKSDSFRTLLAYCVLQGWSLIHCDVQTAFLYGKLDEDIYLLPPQGYQPTDENLVCKLNQALYGLKQSSKVWYNTFSDHLVKIGFTRFNSDKCLFEFKIGNSNLILGLYVDDMIIIYSDINILNVAIGKIESKFKLKRNADNFTILGFEITQHENKITLKQEGYINKLLQKYHMQDCKGVSTPMDVNTDFGNFHSSKKIDQHKYQELIGSLLYLACKSRADIAFSVTVLSKYNTDPREIHWNAAKRVLRYLQFTKKLGLVYTVGDTKLEGFTDASWNSKNFKCSFGVTALFSPVKFTRIRTRDYVRLELLVAQKLSFFFDLVHPVQDGASRCLCYAPEHIFAFIRSTKQDLWERPLLIIKQLEEHEHPGDICETGCLLSPLYVDSINQPVVGDYGTWLEESDLHQDGIVLQSKSRKRLREPGNPDLDKCVLKWFKQARDKKIPVSGHLIRSKAEQFATEMGKTDFKASSGWLDGFKERNKISFKTICGESGAVNLQVAEQWKNNLRDLIQDKDARDVFNLPLLMIGKAANPRCFKNVKTKPVDYANSARAWMTSYLFEKWLLNLDKKYTKEKRKVILFINNCTAHNSIPPMENVEVIFFPANMTSVIQPMDKGVIKNLKHFYRRFLVENILTGDSEALKIKIGVLQASRLCKKAWDQLTSETIKHCFKKAGFVKKEEDEENADDIIAETMPSVDGWEDVISNPTISYNDFLNVDAVCGEITDADIIAEVLNHNIEKQDGDEASGDEDESSVAGEMNVPSADEATNYIMHLRRFFESKNDTGSTTQWQADLAPKEMAAFDMRNRHHVQPLLSWSTNAAYPVSLD